MIKKLISTILSICMFVSILSGTTISFAETNDIIKGNTIPINDSVTGCTYNYINFNGKDLYRPYMGKQTWTTDGKSFVCGTKGVVISLGTIYLYNTETDEFTEVGTGNVSTSVSAVIGTDDCVYYGSGSSIKKYDIKTKKTTTILPGNFNYQPDFITISNDCKYIAFRSPVTDYAWCEKGETGIYRYNIEEKKVECYGYEFPYSNILNHHQINPGDPDIVFFAHETSSDYDYRDIYDREWIVDFKTGEFKNIFKQGQQTNGKSVVFTSHESWGTSGKYLYMNCYSNSAGKSGCIIRCYKDGSHREYMKGEQTGYGIGHASASGDDKFTVVDSGYSNNVYVLSNDTYETFPIYYSETGCKDTPYHPYHAHPNVCKKHYRTDWGMVHDGVLGIGWYDFTDLAKKVAEGGRYPVNEYIDRVSYKGINCESEEITYQGKETDHAKSDKYLYYDINGEVVDGINESVTLSFEYYDNTTKDLKLTYTKGAVTDNDLSSCENSSITIKRNGTNQWIKKEVTIASGNFENINSYRTDFKIGGSADTYIANLCVLDAPDATEVYAGGDGTEQNPYQISNVEQLKYFTNSVRTTTDRTEVDSNISYSATKVSDTAVNKTYTPKRYHVFTNKYFELTEDIDLSGETWTPVGDLVNNFNGHFNGNNHTISNIYIDGTKQVEFGRYAFFGSTGADVEVKNLGLENLKCKYKGNYNKYPVIIDGENYTYTDRLVGVAGFVSTYSGGTFENCYLKNAEVRDYTEQMNSGGTGAFFGLGYGTVKATAENGYNQMRVTNCYVNGAKLRSHSDAYAFIGPNMAPNSTTELTSGSYIITKTLTNCYTANISRVYYKENSLGISDKEKRYDGALYPFTSTTLRTTYNNCYTTSFGEETTVSTDGGIWTYGKGKISDAFLETTDFTTLYNGLVDESNYYNDEKNTNGGYPVFTEPEPFLGWDGVTDKRPKGEGTKESPFLISTKEELLWAKNSVNTISEDGISNGYTSYADSYFKLMNDIDYEGNEWEPIGNNAVYFNGTFDGNGHIVKNFKIMSYQINYKKAYKNESDTAKTTLYTDRLYICNGFFGRTGKDSVVKNFGIENAKINFWNHDYYYNIKVNESDVLTSYSEYRSKYNGTMVGYASGKFINCYVKNSEIKNMVRTINDYNVAGFVGFASGTSSFEGCYVKDTKIAASVYSAVCGFAGMAETNSCFSDCYAACVVEDTDLVSIRDHETTIYGFGYSSSEFNATNCLSELSGYQAKINETTGYKPREYNSDYSMGTDGATKEMIANTVTLNDNLMPDILNENINDGYPICEWESTPFKNCSFSAKKDGETVNDFVAGAVIDGVSFYKNKSAEDCYMYTVLYDKKDGNRMLAYSIDFLDESKMPSKSTHTIKLNKPIALSGDVSRYVLKVFFFADDKKLTPLCDTFEF